MDPSVTFTPEEMRFVLAEIIKTSRLDVDLLARFIATHEAQPQMEQWMMMQIPQGRNLAQCMHIAEQLATQTQTQLKRKWPNEYTAEGSSKRPATANSYEVAQSSSSLHGPVAPLAPGPVTILPRPSNGHGPSPHPLSPPPAPAPKKRGRPSRADKAKRDLRPLLPQRATPRNSDHAFGLTEQRPILPAPLPAHDPGSRPIPRDSVPSVGTLRPGFSAVDMTRPRVLSDGAVERTQAFIKSDLAPIEPQVMDSLPRHTPPRNSPTTLAPLLHKKSPTSSIETPPGQAARPVAPVFNSA